MSDLFKKLNTLVNAKINSALGDVGESARKKIGWKPNQDLDAQVKKLRDQVEKAMATEDELQAQVDKLWAEADRLDQQANAAVKAGQDDNARRLIADHHRAEQRLKMAQADLRQHQFVAEELIYQVNKLEMAVDAAREATDEEGTAPRQQQDAPVTAPTDENMMDVAQQKISELANLMGEKKDQLAAFIERDAPPKAKNDPADLTVEPASTNPAGEKPYQEAIKNANVEDDLESRRNRLSKK